MSAAAVDTLAELELQAGRLRNRIQAIRIDHPEGADHLRVYLAEVEEQIRDYRTAKSEAAS